MMKPTSQKGDKRVEKDLKELGEALVQDSVLYFPVRHHSPACSWHLKRLIHQYQPAGILIEGPESLSSLVPQLADPGLKAPVALYCRFIDHKGYTDRGESGDTTRQHTPERFSAFYPLCDYSPELVAIRQGSELGARIAFCDLDFAVQTVIECRRDKESPSQRAMSLFNEQYLAQNRYLKELARRAGCRDTNELWDRLFETRINQGEPIDFMQKVAAYCYFARENTPKSEMEADGTLAREKRMATLVASEIKRLKRRKEKRPLLVVTGGFHTVALAIKGASRRKQDIPSLELAGEDLVNAIIPYSYQQMDNLNGYAAGMVAPFYYQKLWESSESTGRIDHHAVCKELLVDLSRLTRKHNLPSPLSTADAIAANQTAAELARFRGNPGPMREDILDGIRSSFTKGALDVEGDVVMKLANDLLCGDKVGSLPSHIRTHPLIEDFRNQADKLGLKLDSSRQQLNSLNIYSSERHRKISRFFRILDFIGVPFARFKGGPDFIGGTGLSLTVEHWEYSWSPMTESALAGLSVMGSSLEEAVGATLKNRRDALQAEGAKIDTIGCVGLLLIACRLGLHDLGDEFVPLVADAIVSESRFEVSISSCTQLNLLQQFKSPLEMRRLEQLLELLTTAYRRSCFLLAGLANSPEEQQRAALSALVEARALLQEDRGGLLFDQSLFRHAVQSLLNSSRLEPGLEGGLTGMAFNTGNCTMEELLARLSSQATGWDEKGNRLARFLHGLFTLCRELTWSHEPVILKINTILSGWDDETFYRHLPELRLAFAAHSPQETDKTATIVKAVAGRTPGDKGEQLEWYMRDMNEEFVARCTAVAARVARSLKDDGLSS